MLRGHIDKIEGHIAGWAQDSDQPLASLEVDIFIGGQFYRSVTADLPREDLASLGSGFIKYGFSILTPDGVRADDTVFGRSNGGYIVQGSNAKQSHLIPQLNHPKLLQSLLSRHKLSYSGPSFAKGTEISKRICRSLTKSYRSSVQDFGPLWGSLVETGHGDVIRFALEDKAEQLAAYLSELGRQSLSFGFLGGTDVHTAMLENPAYQTATYTLFVDRALSLAEALGCRPCEDPEQNAPYDLPSLNLEELVGDIAAHVGLGNLQPPVGGYWGIRTSYGLMHMRILDALYASVRINVLRRQLALSGVVEIGGGPGFLAHFVLSLGVAPYKIIDIPSVGAAQAYTLRDQAGLKLYGEDVANPRVELAPPWAMASGDHSGYDLLVNMDSLPEIETKAAVAYLADARAKGFRYFLSINQEFGIPVDGWSQGRVSQLAEKAGGYTLINRYRDWMRKGYVEELYRIDAV